MSARSCSKHNGRGTGGTRFAVEPTNHRWAGKPVEDPIIWVTCPYNFQKVVGDPNRYDKLAKWAKSNFRDGFVIWHEILWVLSPDPGCEL